MPTTPFPHNILNLTNNFWGHMHMYCFEQQLAVDQVKIIFYLVSFFLDIWMVLLLVVLSAIMLNMLSPFTLDIDVTNSKLYHLWCFLLDPHRINQVMLDGKGQSFPTVSIHKYSLPDHQPHLTQQICFQSENIFAMQFRDPFSCERTVV